MEVPETPLTPPEKAMDCLPFSFTFKLISTVPALTFRFQFRVFRLDRVEIAELVEPQNTQLPAAVVVHLSFVEEKFAANHFVASTRVSREFNAPHEELLLLIEFHREVYGLGGVVHIREWRGHEVDVPILPVELFVGVERFANFRREKISPCFSGNTFSRKSA